MAKQKLGSGINLKNNSQPPEPGVSVPIVVEDKHLREDENIVTKEDIVYEKFLDTIIEYSDGKSDLKKAKTMVLAAGAIAKQRQTRLAMMAFKHQLMGKK